jgi:hypothetical protein
VRLWLRAGIRRPPPAVRCCWWWVRHYLAPSGSGAHGMYAAGLGVDWWSSALVL